eukprot:4001131-Amphidinium_carterae.1
MVIIAIRTPGVHGKELLPQQELIHKLRMPSDLVISKGVGSDNIRHHAKRRKPSIPICKQEKMPTTLLLEAIHNTRQKLQEV